MQNDCNTLKKIVTLMFNVTIHYTDDRKVEKPWGQVGVNKNLTPFLT